MLEEALALRAGRGDREALAELVERVRHRLFALAYSELRHYDDAHDAVSAALLRICLHVRQLRQPESVNAWMDSIVRREARRLRRQEGASPLGEEQAPCDHIAAALVRVDIERALRLLPDPHARALRLRYLADLPVREVAMSMCCSEGTVKMWLHRGRQRLAVEMKGYAPMPTETQVGTSPLTYAKTAAILHTDLDPALLAELTRRLEAAGYGTEVVAPTGCEDGDQAARLRDSLKKHTLLVLDERIGGRPALEYVLFLKNREMRDTAMLLLRSEPETYLEAGAYFTAGVERVAQKADAQAMERLFRQEERGDWGNAWGQYSEDARAALFAAEDAAVRLKDTHVSTEHLLLGLIAEDDGAAMSLLRDHWGLSQKRVRDEVLRQTNRDPNRAGAPTAEEMRAVRLTPRSKVVLHLAAEEARSMGVDGYGAQHLLLGLIRESDGFGGRTLAKLGVDLEHARVAVWSGLQGS